MPDIPLIRTPDGFDGAYRAMCMVAEALELEGAQVQEIGVQKRDGERWAITAVVTWRTEET